MTDALYLVILGFGIALMVSLISHSALLNYIRKHYSADYDALVLRTKNKPFPLFGIDKFELLDYALHNDTNDDPALSIRRYVFAASFLCSMILLGVCLVFTIYNAMK
jgi:hypothetical protein